MCGSEERPLHLVATVRRRAAASARRGRRWRRPKLLDALLQRPSLPRHRRRSHLDARRGAGRRTRTHLPPAIRRRPLPRSPAPPTPLPPLPSPPAPLPPPRTPRAPSARPVTPPVPFAPLCKRPARFPPPPPPAPPPFVRRPCAHRRPSPRQCLGGGQPWRRRGPSASVAMQSKAPARRRRRSHHFGGKIRHGRRTARSNRCATRRCPTLKTCRRERRGLAAACDRRARCRDATRRCGGGGGCRCSHACSAGRRRERAQWGATSASSAWPSSRRRASAPRTTRHAPLAPPLRSSGTRTTLATVCRPIARDVNRTDADRVRAPPALQLLTETN